MRRCIPFLIAVCWLGALGPVHADPLDENITYGYAQVLRASPVYANVRVRTPEQRCDAPAGAGQRAGRSDALAGNARCRTVIVSHDERRLAGYDVEYQYKGEKYMSRLESDPGNRLRVRVSVVPDQRALGYR